MTERDREFADAARVVDESAIMRTIARITDVFVERHFQGRGLRFVSAALKGPLYLVCAGAGLITHALLLQLMPERLAPVKPMAYWMALAFVAFAAAAGFITNRSDNTASADNAAGTANTRKSSLVE